VRIFTLFLLLLFALDLEAKDLKLFTKTYPDRIDLYAKSAIPATITVTYRLSLTNLSAWTPTTITKVIQPQGSIKLTSLEPVDPTKRWNIRSSYNYAYGSTKAQHDNRTLYRLPFKKGRKVRISQGFNTNRTHKGESKYAVDFDMRVGSEVYAARDGIVVKVKEDSKKSGKTRAFIKHTNNILIEHSDGTLGSYSHLKYQGAKVKVGQRVKKGDLIALSGNTGYSTGPHLHFVVYKLLSVDKRESIKIKFSSASGVIHEPIEGRAYQVR
jgi:murein DD-endopeptidase MepM/ murein hydrolase activator NlpD